MATKADQARDYLQKYPNATAAKKAKGIAALEKRITVLEGEKHSFALRFLKEAANADS